MRRLIRIFELKDEAKLLDSRSYIIKAALTVITAYSIAMVNPILKLDTISVLFGAMLTLEPVAFTGVKSGFNQLFASMIGGLSTALIILFLGVNAFTAALAMAFTLYICLRMNWREVSPVAIFTSIYMTQYIQKNAQGDPSILLTLRLRMAALGFGIIIAIIFNLVFALLAYRSIIDKRISFLLSRVIMNMEELQKGLQEDSPAKIYGVKQSLPVLFNTIDWVFNMFEDMKKDYRVRLKRRRDKFDIEKVQDIILHMRTIAHLNYDICYCMGESSFKGNEELMAQFNDVFTVSIFRLTEIRNNFIKGGMESIKETSGNSNFKYEKSGQVNHASIRIIDNALQIEDNVNDIFRAAKSLYR